MPITSNQRAKSVYWDRLRDDFEYFEPLFSWPHETEEEARGRKVVVGRRSKWEPLNQFVRDDFGEVERWERIPYIEVISKEYLATMTDRGLAQIPRIRQHLKARKLSREFVRDWGEFCLAAGALETVWGAKTDASRLRAGQASREKNSLDAHRRWFAHYCLRAFDHYKKMKPARNAVLGLIRAIVRGGIPAPEPFGVGWFSKFLSPKSNHVDNWYELTKEFDEKLTKKQMEALRREGMAGVPTLDLEIPALAPAPKNQKSSPTPKG